MRQQIPNEIPIDLSNVHNCEEKEVIVSFNNNDELDQETKNLQFVSSLWNTIDATLRLKLSTLQKNKNQKEWFDEYSIYYKEYKTSNFALIKNIDDFGDYLNDFISNVGHQETGPSCLIVKVEWSIFFCLAFFGLIFRARINKFFVFSV